MNVTATQTLNITLSRNEQQRVTETTLRKALNIGPDDYLENGQL